MNDRSRSNPDAGRASPINLARFDLASLRLFVLTVDVGSLTGGAERFGISLAAASKRIAELEAHLGQPLLARSKRGVLPTPAGRTLAHHAIELVGRLEQLAVAMDDFRRGAQGHLRLWANTSAFGGFLPDMLAAYCALYPDVRIDLEDALSDDAARAVASGSAELAVIGENTAADGLESFVCHRDVLSLLVPRGHVLEGRHEVGLAEALGYDVVALGPTTSLTRQIAAAATEVGRNLRVRVQVRSFDAMCRMVGVGLGVAILPRAGALPHLDSLGLSLVPLEGPWMQRRLLLAWKAEARLSPHARAFVDLVQARLALDEAPWGSPPDQSS